MSTNKPIDMQMLWLNEVLRHDPGPQMFDECLDDLVNLFVSDLSEVSTPCVIPL